MKLKYFISFIALIALLASCSDEDSMTLLDDIQVSKSIVSIDVGGGSETITITAKSDWVFDKVFQQITKLPDGSNDTTYTETPAWLNVSQMSGPAGETKVTFSADSASDSRSVELLLMCNGKTQRINVIQGVASTDIITIKEAIAMVQANQNIERTVFVKGIVCKIDEISKQYGNATYYISDDGTFKGKYSADGSGDGNWLEVYRGYWIDGEKFIDGNEFEVGDEMVITGIIMSYKGTPEIKEKTGQVISHTKSLIKLDSLSTKEALPAEGGNVTAILTCKGNGISVSIPEDAKDWLYISGINGSNVTFHALANPGGDRSANVLFKTTDDKGKEYTAQATINQKGSIAEVTVAEFLAAPVGNANYRITGVITQVADAETGNIYVRDWSDKTVYAYHVGAKGEFKATGLKAGDVITLEGKRSEYQGNPQMSSGAIVDYKVVTPVTIAEFLAKEDDPDVYYMVTGTIDEIKDPLWGNLYLTDGSGRLYVYGTYPGWGATGTNRQNWLSTANIEVGDELTVIGVRSTFGDVVELKGGIYFSHEKGD